MLPADEPVIPDWWRAPRRISVVVDNPSWILPHAEALVAWLRAAGEEARLCRTHDDILPGAVAFFLGCVRLAPDTVLARNQRNLVVHESDLPQGRGFAPLTWQILEGRHEIPICLLEMDALADAGPVVFRDVLRFEGHELNDELRRRQGEATVALCRRYLDNPVPPAGIPQIGEPTYYPRRRPLDSELSVEKTLAEQFDLLRTVDNERYPAFFVHRGHRYRLAIHKEPNDAS